MSDIPPVGRSSAAALDQVRQANRPTAPTGSGAEAKRDQVELSSQAQLLSKIAELPDVRESLVVRVRSELAAGTYETPDKLEAAIDALLAEEFAG